jgi:hypothetical protein
MSTANLVPSRTVTYCDVLAHSLYNEGDEIGGVAVGRLVAVGAKVGVAVGSSVTVAVGSGVAVGAAQPMSNSRTTARRNNDSVRLVCASKLLIDEPSWKSVLPSIG